MWYSGDIISINSDGTTTKLESRYSYNGSWNFDKAYTLPSNSIRIQMTGRDNLKVYEIYPENQ